MKKLAAIVLLGLCVSHSVAEESGAFMGVNLVPFTDFGQYKASGKVSGVEVLGEDISFQSIGIGVLAGYKQFFTENFGLRYYANVDISTSFSSDDIYDVFGATLLNYAANIDALYSDAWGGIYAGLGFGMNTWSGSTIDDIKTAFAGIASVSTSSFAMHLNLGYRFHSGHHGLEIGIKVPFMKTALLSASEAATSVDFEIRQTFNISMRYVFSF